VAQQAASEQTPRITVGSLKAVPGGSVMLPLTLAADPKTPLRSISVDIEYVSNSLQFQKASLGIGAELVSAKVETSLTESAPDSGGIKRAKLRVTASLPEPAPKEGLPGGVLAYLLFQLKEDAKPFIIRMVPTVISAQDLSTPPKNVASVGTEPGQIAVDDPQTIYDRMVPAVVCFFFTH
jgi:hypothetical protein